jgi:hypothetical protein
MPIGDRLRQRVSCHSPRHREGCEQKPISGAQRRRSPIGISFA